MKKIFLPSQGAQFDENGELNNWWDASDQQSFLLFTLCYMYQYQVYQWDGYDVSIFMYLE